MPVPPPNDPLQTPLQLRFLPEEDTLPTPSWPGTQPKPSTPAWPLVLVSIATLGIAWHHQLLPLPQLSASPRLTPEPSATELAFPDTNDLTHRTGPAAVLAIPPHGQSELPSHANRDLMETAAHWDKNTDATLCSSQSSSPSLANARHAGLPATTGQALPQPAVARDIGDDRPVKLSVYDAVHDGTDCRPILEVVRLLASQQAKVRQSAMDELRLRGWSEAHLKYALELASGSPGRQMEVLQALEQEPQLNLLPWLEWMASDGAPAVSRWAQAQLAASAPTPHNKLLSQPQVVTAAFAASQPNSSAEPPVGTLQDAAE